MNASADPVAKSQVLMRVPVAGGSPERVADAGRAATLACSKVIGGSCVIEERTPDQKEVVFTDLDPVRGRGHELARITSVSLPTKGFCRLDDVCYPWALSQDGGTIAVHGHESNRIELISTKEERRSSLEVRDWSVQDLLSWSARGDDLFMSATRGNEALILRVGLNGETRAIWREKGDYVAFAFPSPDSRLLALVA